MLDMLEYVPMCRINALQSENGRLIQFFGRHPVRIVVPFNMPSAVSTQTETPVLEKYVPVPETKYNREFMIDCV